MSPKMNTNYSFIRGLKTCATELNAELALWKKPCVTFEIITAFSKNVNSQMENNIVGLMPLICERS